MAAKHMVEVPLPEGVEPTALDLELLKATFQAIASLRCESSHEWKETLQQLETAGWKVSWGLTWTASAKRGEQFEEARGVTLDETFAELEEQTRVASVGHCP